MVDQVLELTNAILQQGAVRIEAMERTFGRKASLNREVSNDSFSIFEFGGSDQSTFRKAEVRIRKSSGVSKITVIELNTNLTCIKRKDISDKFGPRAEVVPPPARHAGRVPIYYVYKYQEGELKFGMESGGRECCVNIVVEFKS
jgi:hypothetical protein